MQIFQKARCADSPAVGESQSQLVQRLLCARAKVDLQRVRNGFLADRDFQSLTTAAATLGGAKMFIDDTAASPLSNCGQRPGG